MSHSRALRHGSTVAAVALAAIIVLTSCSGGTPDSVPVGLPASLPPAEGHTQYPVTLESPWGSTILEHRPTRIAAVVPNAIDAELLLALGVTPVLASSMISDSSAYLDAYGAADLKTYPFTVGGSLPVEAVAASEPDLIVTVGWNAGLGGADLAGYYNQLSEIAPVLTNAEASSSVMIPWQESIVDLGEALDLPDAAAAVIDEHEARFETVREQNPQFAGRTATWAIWYGTGTGLHYFSQPESAPESFLLELGFAPNPLARSFEAVRQVSDELMSSIDADVLILGRSSASSDAEYQQLVESPLFNTLQSVSTGHFAQVPPLTPDGGDVLWAVTSGGPIGNAWAADHILPLVSAAV
ncbi:ABC transporter substrate-binding protein [Rhodococcus sp. 06-621-2]|nr:ABC transporter substrate-binding protein [Rhodococcus sp. 06-621-2]OZC56793.1 ABC transporter substrate-binding protein [Rhodococcus sp. 06-621-2]